MTIQNQAEENKILQLVVAASEEFLQSAGSELNYQKITDDILNISCAKYAIFNLYDEDGSKFTTVALSAPQGTLKTVSSLVGFILPGKSWEQDLILAEKVKYSTVTHFPSLHELTGEVIPKSVVVLLEKTFSTGEVIVVKIVKENTMIGNFTLIMPCDVRFKNDNYVELYTRQLGLLITRKRAEEALRESAEKFSKAFQTSPYAITITRVKDGKFIEVNAAFTAITGFSREEADADSSINLKLWVSMENRNWVLAELKAGSEVKDREFQFRKKNNEIMIGLFSAQIIHINTEPFVLSSISDITDRKRAEKEILHLSFHDHLTGLYNRRFFEEELKRLDTDRQLPLSFIICDLNGLKIINDIFGHAQGDELLIETAEILKKICRSDDIIARWGGDEFALLLPKTSVLYTEEIIDRIKKECMKTKILKIPVSISLGTSTKETKDRDIETIVADAESNMYKNKLAQKESLASSIIFALEQALYEKSNETKEHADRMHELAIKLGKSIRLPSHQLDELSLLASLHDIGKVAIPETILLKKGKLTDREWTVIKKHPEIGFNIAQSSPQISHVAKSILSCHENWDGSGYPLGLMGESIPVISRIILIADAYDVMTSGRVYKKPMSKEDAIDELKRCAGTQFDPALVDKAIEILSNGQWVLENNTKKNDNSK